MTMAENLDDGEFWLPPQFLSDAEAALDDDHHYSKNNNVDDPAEFPTEFPYGFFGVPPSNMSSPLGGSSETESDEEEQHQLAELTRLMARSSLEADFNKALKSTGQLVASAGSPQSTLCAFGTGCGCRNGSSQGSPNNTACKLSSARATWDLLHAAAGEVERMRLNQEQSFAFNNHCLNGPFVNSTATNPDVGFFAPQSLSHQQLQFAQFEMLRQQQMAKQRQNIAAASAVAWSLYQQRHGRNPMVAPNGGRNNNNGPLGLAASAWPSLQHANGKMQQQKNQQFGVAVGNGMRAVNFGGGRREYAGTGVFLPRTAESKKKPACSTALVPDRVVRAINRKMEDMVGGQHRLNASSNMENAAVPRLKSNHVHYQQKRNIKPQPAVNYEIKLPQEWTY